MIKEVVIAVPVDRETNETVWKVAYQLQCSKAEVVRRALSEFLTRQTRKGGKTSS